MLLPLIGLKFLQADIEMQDICMQNTADVLEFEPPEGQAVTCNWPGVKCVANVVQWIQWNSSPNVRVHSVQWLPPGLISVFISNQDIDREFVSKSLPRSLKECRFIRCDLSGRIISGDLPRNLLTLNLCYNVVSGPLILADLPKTLGGMDIRFNPIHEVFVDSPSLPGSLIQIVLSEEPGPSSVKVWEIHGKKVDKRIEVWQQEAI